VDSVVTLAGNITRDPEERVTTSGRSVVSFSLAVNRKFQVSGEWQEQISFFNVTCWGELADNVAASLHKGDRVVIAGRLEQRSYEDKDGNKRQAVDVIATEVGPSLRWARANVVRVPRDAPVVAA